MKNEDIFGGFSGMFGTPTDHGDDTGSGHVVDIDANEEIEQPDADDTDTEDRIDPKDIATAMRKANGLDTEDPTDEPIEEDDTESELEDIETNEDDAHDINDFIEDESLVAKSMYSLLAEKLNMDADEDDGGPESFDDLIDRLEGVIHKRSVPTYANDKMRELDEFVYNGGDLREFFTQTQEYMVAETDLDTDAGQKKILTQYLKHQNFDEEGINKKIAGYEMAGLLSSEAEDAYSRLSNIAETKQKELLLNQEKARVEFENQQQQIYNDVVTNINDLNEINGVKVSLDDKKELTRYLFEPTKSGLTQWQEDGKDIKNIVTAAFLMRKGATLIDSAKKKGKSEAFSTIRKGLRNQRSPKGKQVEYHSMGEYDDKLKDLTADVSQLFGVPV